MITDIEMEAMELLLEEFQNKAGYEREHYAMGAMQDMLAAMDSDKFYSMTDKEKQAFVKEFADAIVNERERVSKENEQTRWICVYKDTIAPHAESDNLVNIELPAEWLYKALKADGVEDIEAWFDEYTADSTEMLARDALSNGVILGCDDEYVATVLKFRREHSDLVERLDEVKVWFDGIGENVPEGLGFEHSGTWINNPFYDESLRFNVEPFAYYGVENMTTYLQQAENFIEHSYEQKIDEAIHELFHVDENNTIQLYADRGETSQFLWKTLHDNADSPDLESLVRDEIWEAYSESINYYEDMVLEKAGLNVAWDREAARTYLQENYTFEPPYDHYLKDTMKVNILLVTPDELNSDCVGIHLQHVAMVDPERLTTPGECLSADTMLNRLLEQQGHPLEELRSTFKDYDEFFYDAENGSIREHFTPDGHSMSLEQRIDEFNKTHNSFLTSVCQELENQRYSMGVLTVLAKVSVEDFIKMQQGAEVVMPQNATLGIYDPWNGSGSCLEIELEKEFVFSTELVRNMQIEGVKPAYEYTVDDSFELVGSCWKEPVSVEALDRGPIENELSQSATRAKPSLESTINNAASRVDGAAAENNKDIELDK